MTKQEFIQEAALRLITAWPNCCDMAKDIPDTARALADELYKEEEQEAEPEKPLDSLDKESVNKVANEIVRLEAEDIFLKNNKFGRKVHQKAGLDIRFLNVCHAQYSSYESCISTVKELVDCGRVAFARRKNMGPLTMKYVDKALENLYGVTSW